MRITKSVTTLSKNCPPFDACTRRFSALIRGDRRWCPRNVVGYNNTGTASVSWFPFSRRRSGARCLGYNSIKGSFLAKRMLGGNKGGGSRRRSCGSIRRLRRGVSLLEGLAVYGSNFDYHMQCSSKYSCNLEHSVPFMLG